jgi:hypothetical protein
MIWNILKSVLGINAELGTTNKIAGGINILALAPLGIWLWSNRAAEITFTYEQMGIFALITLAYIEMNRRAT